MVAYRCDRCGTLFEKPTGKDKPLTYYTIKQWMCGFGEINIDICPDCETAFKKWLAEGTKKAE